MRSFLYWSILFAVVLLSFNPFNKEIKPAKEAKIHTPVQVQLESSANPTQIETAGPTNLQTYLNGESDVLYQHAISELIKTFYIA